MESSSLQMVKMEEKGDTKRKESFPQALVHLQALQNEFSRASHCQRCIPLENLEEIDLILPHQHKCRLALSSHRLASKKMRVN